MCEEAMFSGATGRIDSTMITLPSLGRASQQFFEKFQATLIAPINSSTMITLPSPGVTKLFSMKFRLVF